MHAATPELAFQDAIRRAAAKALGKELFVTASVGISLYPRDGASADALVRNADAAMYQAKDDGRNGYHFYHPELTATALQRVHLEADLRRALARGELAVHYQPQIDLGTGHLIGAEALVRWHHPEQGLIPPDRFIQLAEDTGLIIELGERVLRAACRQAVDWLASGVPIERIAVNVSAYQVQRSDFVATVHRALDTLESRGIVRRHHGGASLVETDALTREHDFLVRIRRHADKKLAIASLVADEVQPGSTVILDGGTTTLASVGASRGPFRINSQHDMQLAASAAPTAIVMLGATAALCYPSNV